MIVAVPVHNEEDHLVACLTALARQISIESGEYAIVLFLNNCTDNTKVLVDGFVAAYRCPVRVIVETHHAASAGWARRRAMDAAVAWLDEVGASDQSAVLTTDADSTVPPDWIARNLATLDAGADAVAGRIVLDPRDAARLPASLHDRGRAEAEYEALLTEIGARLDPVFGDLWPTHWTNSGATLGASRAAYRTVGGMPMLASGEDRAFANLIRAHDLRLRHDPEIVVSTSGRLVGRATGGAADTITRRCLEPDSPCDDRLEQFGRALARMLLRRRLRRRHELASLDMDRTWARALSLSQADVAACLDAYGPARRFEAFHAHLESTSPRLAYRPLTPSRLPRNIVQARLVVMALRWRMWLRHPRPGRGDSIAPRAADFSGPVCDITVAGSAP